VSAFELKNGQIFVLVEAAGGVYGADALSYVCKLAETHSAFLKITEDQRIGFMIPSDIHDDVAAALRAQGLLLRHYQGQGMAAPKACLGELCPHAEQDALGDALELQASLAERFGDDRPSVSLGINGCWRACAGSAIDDFHIVGDSSGYKLSIGGKAREIPQLGQFVTDNIPRESLSSVVGALLEVHFGNVEGDERLVDVLERIGLSPFTEAAERVLHGESSVEASDAPDDALSAEEGSLLAADDTDEVASSESGTDSDAGFGDVPLEPLGEDDPLSEDVALGEEAEVEDVVIAESAQDDQSDQSFEQDSPVDDVEPASENGMADDSSLMGSDDDVLLADESAEGDGSPETDAGEEIDEAGLQSGELEEECDLEEDGLDLQDASAEDLARVTSAIRAEVADELAEDPSAGRETDVNSEILAFEKTRQPKPSSTPVPRSVKSTGGLNVRIEAGVLALALPGGAAFRCPLDALANANGEVLAFQTEEGTLSISFEDDRIMVRHGALEIGVPIGTRAA
jgi:dissimilatory sulfite reductase (desulfoviridin) alpha/beta subunit